MEIMSCTQPNSPTRTKHDEQLERPQRSFGMTLNPESGPPPQPTGNASTLAQSSSQQTFPGFTNQTVLSPEESLTRTSSSAGLSMDEPRVLPGVVSRRRQSSLRSGTVDDSEALLPNQLQQPAHSGFKRGKEGSVVKEQDSGDE